MEFGFTVPGWGLYERPPTSSPPKKKGKKDDVTARMFITVSKSIHIQHPILLSSVPRLANCTIIKLRVQFGRRYRS